LERTKNQRETEEPVPREYIFPARHYRKALSANSYREVPPFIHLGLRDHHYYYRELRKATQFSKIVRKGKEWTANHEGMYDSLGNLKGLYMIDFVVARGCLISTGPFTGGLRSPVRAGYL